MIITLLYFIIILPEKMIKFLEVSWETAARVPLTTADVIHHLPLCSDAM